MCSACGGCLAVFVIWWAHLLIECGAHVFCLWWMVYKDLNLPFPSSLASLTNRPLKIGLACSLINTVLLMGLLCVCVHICLCGACMCETDSVCVYVHMIYVCTCNILCVV